MGWKGRSAIRGMSVYVEDTKIVERWLVGEMTFDNDLLNYLFLVKMSPPVL